MVFEALCAWCFFVCLFFPVSFRDLLKGQVSVCFPNPEKLFACLRCSNACNNKMQLGTCISYNFNIRTYVILVRM